MSSIMVQGTASSAGKSLLTAALCRIFLRDGYSVCPFKSQNMSLNSYVTGEGLEMGRAQVLQAQAAGIAPSVKMNPVLLKPTTDRKSQVILNGRPYANMDAVKYFAFKSSLRETIKEIYNGLAENYDIMVIEGAGSPAEINLKSEDIVNMGMAEIADAPVLLVADIDRGGVFASIYGTVMLLEPEERARIKGIVINKFRGDIEILKPGLRKLEELCGIPVVGVIPYLLLDLEDEDSAGEFQTKRSGAKSIEICAIKLPRLSNFTDLDPFKSDSDISLRYVSSPEEIANADLIVIPGSKNTIEDLRWLKKCGLADAILKSKAVVFGLCGGYQMMGSLLIDTEGWEVTPGDTESGLGIFDTVTEFIGDKITRNVKGEALGKPIAGYEIHCGKTRGGENRHKPFSKIALADGTEAPYSEGMSDGEKYFGTYVHGVFDSGLFREEILNAIRSRKNLALKLSRDRDAVREEELEKLGRLVRENLDMERIYEILKREGFPEGVSK